jgi:hypothetical protein
MSMEYGKQIVVHDVPRRALELVLAQKPELVHELTHSHFGTECRHSGQFPQFHAHVQRLGQRGSLMAFSQLLLANLPMGG